MSGGLFQDNYCVGLDCDGGGLASAGSLSLNGTRLLGNASRCAGGAAYADRQVLIQNGLLQKNQCGQALCPGGGAFASQAITLTNSLLKDNPCLTTGCQGGGVYTQPDASQVLSATQLIHNSAASQGGGIYAGGPARVVNGLFARNTAGSAGAALYLSDAASSTLLYDPLAGPAAGTVPAITIVTSTVGITNTIITSHTTGLQVSSGSVTEDCNLFFGVPTRSTGLVNSGGHSFSGNPVFADAAHDDYHLWTGSAAINRALDVGIYADADGDARPFGGGFDIGQDEFHLRHLFLALMRR